MAPIVQTRLSLSKISVRFVNPDLCDTFKPLNLSTIIGTFSFLQENIIKLFPLTIATKVDSFNSLMTLQYVHAGNPNSYY